MKRLLYYMLATFVFMVGSISDARADTIAANMTGFGITGNGQFTVGWQFNVTTTISVTQLGWMGNQLNGNHQVAIWTVGGTLLAMDTVSTTDPLTGLFRYKAISPLVLGPGAYIIAGENDARDIYGGLAANFSTASGIQYVTGKYQAGTGLQFPLQSDNSNGPEIFGPNFQFNAVPVPAGVVMASIGMIGIAGYTWLRNRKIKHA